MGRFPKIKKIFADTKDIVIDIFQRIRSGELRWISGSLAFTSILSLVPFLALVLVTFKMVGGLDYLAPQIESLLLSYFKEAAGSQATVWVRAVIEKVQAKTIGSTAIIFLMMTSWRLFSDMEKGFQRIWRAESARPIYKRFFVVWFAILLFPLSLAFYVAIRSFDFIKPLAQSYNMSFDAVALIGFLFIIYKVFPASKVMNRVALISSLFSSTGVMILQKTFTFIAKKAFYMNKFYGSLAAIPLILIWTLTLWQILLLGTALGSSIQKKLLKDT